MDLEKMVKDAVELAKVKGVQFREGTPTFRPENEQKKTFFHIEILTNTSLNTAGHAILDQPFTILNKYDKKTLANCFIDIFNELNIERKVEKIK